MKYDRLIVGLLDSGKLFVFACRIYMRCGCCHFYRPVRLWPDKDGYLKFSLQDHGRTVHLRAHRVVHVAAYGPTTLEVDHVEGDRSDYRLCRLHPVTRQENVYRMMPRRHWQPEDASLPEAVPF